MTAQKSSAGKRDSVTGRAATAVEKTATAKAVRAEPVVNAALLAAPKAKSIRDSFTIPKQEYAVLDTLKLRATSLRRPTKKGEVLRAGLFALSAMNDKSLLDALNSVPSLKTGRPRNCRRNRLLRR